MLHKSFLSRARKLHVAHKHLAHTQGIENSLRAKHESMFANLSNSYDIFLPNLMLIHVHSMSIISQLFHTICPSHISLEIHRSAEMGDDLKLGFFERLACNILKAGAIPRHVAFIMDGNRRYAQKAGLAKVDGHKQGFDTLARVLDWCRELGINQVTLYAFSVENFKRTQEEIDSIMNLARKKCDSILDELDQVNEAGIKVRVAGDMNLLPQDLRDRIDKIQELTKDNNRGCLNICLAYTSRHELVGTVKKLSTLVQTGRCQIDDLDLNLFEQNLSLPRPFPDLIIRTSGEVRLSDFMLWQCQESILMFVDALWPEISIWDFLKAIFYYQYQRIK